ncbi:MAG: hypothetical protein OZSIB_1709 [Candidatus Ozemobacter sibiricus]|uniref:Uncharacterized protein n=1 Tax=Candidatus Ozemobacter sibiricus TaxID=2268124 RepID=A0A367ZJ84_9BACT|nr:MAG: hypothetical protein OZSIB_1709 [Candidatus Ozemobacter sibiricus]
MPTMKAAALPAPVETDILREVVLPALVVTLGVFVQILWSAWVGLFILAGGFLFGYSQGWAKDPRLNFSPSFTSNPGKRWVQVTSTEIARLKKKMEVVDRLSPGCLGSLANGCASLLVFFVTMIVVGLLSEGVPGYFQEDMLGVATLDLVFLGIWYFWICIPSTWKPDLIEFKLPVFEKVLTLLPEVGMGKWSREYQFELTKTAKGEVPTDIKLLLKPPEAPKEFLGVQGQVAINRGGPYVYFVVITRPTLPIVKVSSDGRDVLEAKSEKDVNILVIRQYADKHGGYQTRQADHQRLLELVAQVTARTLAAAPPPRSEPDQTAGSEVAGLFSKAAPARPGERADGKIGPRPIPPLPPGKK